MIVFMFPLLLLVGCSVGKGYVFEPVTQNKCVEASVSDGQLNVDTPIGVKVTITGSGTYASYIESGCHKENQ